MLTADYVIEEGKRRADDRRAQDGRIAWKKQGRFHVAVQERTGRLILVGPDAVEVAQAGDGRSLARFPMPGRGGANILTDGDLIVVEGWGAGTDPILVIDPQLRAPHLAKNVPFLSRAVADVLLSQNVGMSGVNRENAPLKGTPSYGSRCPRLIWTRITRSWPSWNGIRFHTKPTTLCRRCVRSPTRCRPSRKSSRAANRGSPHRRSRWQG